MTNNLLDSEIGLPGCLFGDLRSDRSKSVLSAPCGRAYARSPGVIAKAHAEDHEHLQRTVASIRSRTPSETPYTKRPIAARCGAQSPSPLILRWGGAMRLGLFLQRGIRDL